MKIIKTLLDIKYLISVLRNPPLKKDRYSIHREGNKKTTIKVPSVNVITPYFFVNLLIKCSSDRYSY